MSIEPLKRKAGLKYRAVVSNPTTGKKDYGEPRNTKKEAKRDEILLMLALGTATKGETVTVDAACRYRIVHGNHKGVADSVGHSSQLRYVSKLLPAWFKDLPVSKVKVSDVYKALDEVANVHQRSKAKQLLSTAFQKQILLDNMTTNPAKEVAVKIPRAKEIEVPTTDEVAAIVAEAKDDWTLFFRVAVATSARRGEVCGLKWSDLDGNSLMVKRAVAETKGRCVVKGIKTGAKGERPITLGPELMKALESAERTSEWMFDREVDGKRTHRKPDSASQAFRKTVIRLGLRYSINSLRHYGATQMLSQRISIATVSKRLGHSSPMMVLSTYAHWLPLDDEEAANLLDC